MAEAMERSHEARKEAARASGSQSARSGRAGATATRTPTRRSAKKKKSTAPLAFWERLATPVRHELGPEHPKGRRGPRQEIFSKDSDRMQCTFRPQLPRSGAALRAKAGGGGSGGGEDFFKRQEALLRRRERNLEEARDQQEREQRAASRAPGRPSGPGSSTPASWAKSSSDFFERQRAFERRREQRLREEKEALLREATAPRRVVWDRDSKSFVEVRVGGPGDGEEEAGGGAVGRKGGGLDGGSSRVSGGGRMLWEDVREDFLGRLEEQVEGMRERRRELAAGRGQLDPECTFRPVLNPDPDGRFSSRWEGTTFLERMEAEARRLRRRNIRWQKEAEAVTSGRKKERGSRSASGRRRSSGRASRDKEWGPG